MERNYVTVNLHMGTDIVIRVRIRPTWLCYESWNETCILGRIACIAWMRPIATDVARSVVSVSVCVAHTGET